MFISGFWPLNLIVSLFSLSVFLGTGIIRVIDCFAASASRA